jgi:hypothetical protein
MQNKVTSTMKDEDLVEISSLDIGQLFCWNSSSYGKILGIRTVSPNGGGAYGVTLSEGTYLTNATKVIPVPTGTTVQTIAG